MTESTLALTYTQLVALVARYLGLLPVAGLSATDITLIDDIIASGLRQFYFPPPVGNERPYQWSFLTPVTTLDTIAPYSTGTIAVTITGKTVTLTDGVWPSWTATHGSLVIDTTEYVIASRTDDTHLELASAWTEDTETASDYVLKHDGNYDLPDDFGGIQGRLVIESVNYQPEITLIGEGRIRQMRQTRPQNQQSTSSTTTPYWAAVRPKVQVTTTGQRFEILFFPLPNDVYTISYPMRVLPQMLVTTTIEYPYGGTEHAETIKAACIAAAEEMQNGNRLNGSPVYDKKNLFKERLSASISLDKQMNGIDFYGYNGDSSDIRHRDWNDGINNRRRGCDFNNVTYNGSID